MTFIRREQSTCALLAETLLVQLAQGLTMPGGLTSLLEPPTLSLNRTPNLKPEFILNLKPEFLNFLKSSASPAGVYHSKPPEACRCGSRHDERRVSRMQMLQMLVVLVGLESHKASERTIAVGLQVSATGGLKE